MRLLQQSFRCGVALFGTFIFPMFAYCRLFPLPDIAKLANSSPVIVVGEVLRVVQVGNEEIPMPDGKPYVCASMTAFIRVDETLKGGPANGTIEVDYPQNANWESGPLTNVLREGTYLMFFLKPDGEKFAFADPQQSAMPMSRSHSAASDSSDADLYTQVLRHLGEGLFDEQASSEDRRTSIFEIDFEQVPTVAKMFKEALDSPAARSDREYRFELLAALVRHKDVSVLPDLETALLTNHDVALDNARGNMIYALQQIDPSLADPILIQALRLPEAQMRVTAAAALGHAPTDDAIAALFGSLDDSDREVRRSVINTLTSIFRESQSQCLPEQPDAEELFGACLEHWKEFAATHNVPPYR